MRFHLLGDLEAVTDAGVHIGVGPPLRQAVLAVLLLNVGRKVHTTHIIDALWPDDPPAAAGNIVQGHVSHLRAVLRRVLGRDGAIPRSAGGYVLEIDPAALDVTRFDDLVDVAHRARAAGRLNDAAAAVTDALALCRGRLLDGLTTAFPFAEIAAAGFDARHLAAQELRIAVELGRGRHREILPVLEPLARTHPLHDGLLDGLVTALIAAGRRGDAIAALRRAQQAAEDWGIPVSDRLTALRRTVLDASTAAESPGVPRGIGRSPRGTAVVGRTAELDRLQRAWREVLDGSTRFVLVSGEPGIGKTTLAQAFTRYIAPTSTAVGVPWLDSRTSGYRPWVEVVRSIKDDQLATARSRLSSTQRSALAILVAGEQEPAPHLGGSVASAHAEDLVQGAVAALLVAAAEHTPLVVVLDDLHWFDDASLRLLRHLLNVVTDARLLILGLYRDIGTADHPRSVWSTHRDALLGHRRSEQVAVGPLAPDAAHELVAYITGAAPADSVIDALTALTARHPMYLTITTSTLVEDGRYVGDHEATRRISTAPPTLRGQLKERVAVLSPQTRNLVDVGAVMGPRFRIDVAAEVLGYSVIDALEAVEEASTAAFLVGDDEPGVLTFRHELVRVVLRDAIHATRRAVMHGAICTALEHVVGVDDAHHFGELLRHALAASPTSVDRHRIGRYALRAADAECKRFNYAAAAGVLEQALDAAGRLTVRDRCAVALRLAEVRMRAGEIGAARAGFDAAAQLAWAEGDGPLLARAALGYGSAFDFTIANDEVNARERRLLEDALDHAPDLDDATHARLLGRLAASRYWMPATARSAFDEPRERWTAQAVALARRSGRQDQLGWVLADRCFATWSPDSLNERQRLADEIVALAVREHDAELLLEGLRWRLVGALETGDPVAYDRARTRYERIAVDIQQPIPLYWAAVWQSALGLMEGRFDEVERLAMGRSLELGLRLEGRAAADMQNGVGGQLLVLRFLQERVREFEAVLDQFLDSLPQVPAFHVASALIALELGRMGDARTVLDRLVEDDFARLPRDGLWLLAVSLAGHIAGEVNSPEHARVVHDALLPYADRCAVTSFGFAWVGPIALYLGITAAALGRHDEALRWLEDAEAIAERMGAAPFLAEIRSRRAVELDIIGQHNAAAALAAAVRIDAERLGLPAVLRRLVALRRRALDA
jgi:DNA-binding SARP family transcriptional activator/tetratricopeptide (TPR) repeat protein/energy-coupling factor transporter ATP-binding protein EcfA2